VHADHQDSVARLDGSLSAEGLLMMRLQLPASVFDAGPAADRATVLQSLLQSPDQVFRLETNQDCSTAKVQVISVASGQDSVIDGGIELEYRYECGVGNRVRVVNIELFGLLQGLEEVVVQMDTMAAGKRFAINRLCDKPIFRLQ
jgi:hypothetical protein